MKQPSATLLGLGYLTQKEMRMRLFFFYMVWFDPVFNSVIYSVYTD